MNAGKSLRNEDQARIHVGYLENRPTGENGHCSSPAEFHTPPSTPEKEAGQPAPPHRLPYVYFALFDGHAGTGAAVSASQELHNIVLTETEEKLIKAEKAQKGNVSSLICNFSLI